MLRRLISWRRRTRAGARLARNGRGVIRLGADHIARAFDLIFSRSSYTIGIRTMTVIVTVSG